MVSQAFKRHAELGYLALSTGLKDVPLPGGISFEEWDSWHTLICTDELSRVVRCILYDGCKRLANYQRHTQAFYGDSGEAMVSEFLQ